MRSTRYFMWLNIVFELTVPIVGIVLLHTLHKTGYFGLELNFAVFISYLFYVPIVVMGNLRRFPRVVPKALFSFFAPLLIMIIIAMLTTASTEMKIMVTSLHFFTAVLLAGTFEVAQTWRVPAIRLPIWLMAFFFATSAFAIFGMNAIALPEFLETEISIVWAMQIIIWIFGLVSIVILKLHRAGKRLYAKSGYRPSAAVVIVNERGEVLLCERVDRPGAVQTVKGGVDPGETPEQAARRELTEEIGIWPDKYELIGALLETQRYDWAPATQEKLKRTGFKGQEQYFFLAKMSSDVKFDLDFHHREFRKVWWDSPERMLQLAWSARREGIENALKGFGLIKKGND